MDERDQLIEQIRQRGGHANRRFSVESLRTKLAELSETVPAVEHRVSRTATWGACEWPRRCPGCRHPVAHVVGGTVSTDVRGVTHRTRVCTECGRRFRTRDNPRREPPRA